MSKSLTTIYLDGEILESYRKEAKKQERSITYLMTNALEHYLRDEDYKKLINSLNEKDLEIEALKLRIQVASKELKIEPERIGTEEVIINEEPIFNDLLDRSLKGFSKLIERETKSGLRTKMSVVDEWSDGRYEGFEKSLTEHKVKLHITKEEYLEKLRAFMDKGV